LAIVVKKNGVLNHTLSEIIATMGHTDMLVIGDAGLPIPRQTQRVDLALSPGIPGFIETVEAVLQELVVEQVIVADEMSEVSPAIYERFQHTIGDATVKRVTHEQLKALCCDAVAVVRTGEFTPYANVVLVSGVAFGPK
jgi:D-ribose pyranase